MANDERSESQLEPGIQVSIGEQQNNGRGGDERSLPPISQKHPRDQRERGRQQANGHQRPSGLSDGNIVEVTGQQRKHREQCEQDRVDSPIQAQRPELQHLLCPVGSFHLHGHRPCESISVRRRLSALPEDRFLSGFHPVAIRDRCRLRHPSDSPEILPGTPGTSHMGFPTLEGSHPRRHGRRGTPPCV